MMRKTAPLFIALLFSVLSTSSFGQGIQVGNLPAATTPISSSDFLMLSQSGSLRKVAAGTFLAQGLYPSKPTTLGGIFSSTGGASQWVTNIDNTGTQQLKQPAFTDISGLLPTSRLTGFLSPAQMPALTGDVVTSQGNIVATVATVNGVAYPTNPALNTVPVVTGPHAVTYETIPVSALTTSTLTLGGTTLTLGATTTSVSGLTLTGASTWNGNVVGITYGGTGTGTTFTQGSIPYAGAAGVYTQDNANLFWDSVNYRLGVGTTVPGSVLDVHAPDVYAVQFNNIGAQGASGGAGIMGLADPGAALTTGSRIGAFVLGGSYNASHVFYNSVGLTAFAAENWSASQAGASIQLESVHTGGSTTRTVDATFLNGNMTLPVGNLTLGTSGSKAGSIVLSGATSGSVTLGVAATAGASTITFPGGSTDFSATGGASQVVRQSSAGAALTVSRLACSDLSNGATGCSTTVGTIATQASNNVSITGGSITGMSTPSVASDVAIKSYVDASSSGISMHTSARLVSTANLAGTYVNGASGVGATLTNSGAQVALAIDSVNTVVGDRVLLVGQSAPAQNGAYTVTTVGSGVTNWVLTRATDFDQAVSNEVIEGAGFLVDEGTVNAASLWVETGAGPFTVGVTGITFTSITVGAALKANNLSDLTSVTSARSNLGLGTAATVNTGTSGATIPLLNGANTFSGILTTTSGRVLTGRTVTAAGAITVTSADDFICVNKTVGAATTVNLEASPTTWQRHVIKDCKFDAATNNITLTPNAGNIDNASTYVLRGNGASANITYNGTQWLVY